MPWGSSCTIVTKLFDVLGQKPTDAQAKCLLAAMMTDTLMLKSPTTTDVDRAVAAALGEQLGVDPVKFGMEVFLSRPSGSFTAEQMVGNDIKLFEVAGKKLLIGQYETVDKSRALGMVDEIRAAMRAYQAEKGADGIVLCVTDIMEEGSQVLLEGDTVAAQKGLRIEDVPEGVWCPGVLSRKKQVAAPHSRGQLTGALSSATGPASRRRGPVDSVWMRCASEGAQGAGCATIDTTQKGEAPRVPRLF